jgi:hypothetical protein
MIDNHFIYYSFSSLTDELSEASFRAFVLIGAQPLGKLGINSDEGSRSIYPLGKGHPPQSLVG